MLRQIQSWLRIRFVEFLTLLITVLFLITVVLTFNLLTIDSCNCPIRHVENTAEIERNVGYSSSHKLAVLVPFRDRFDELLEFVPYMHNFLHKQHINHNIFILNQVDPFRFNRASLINVGYLYTSGTHDYIAMHDVDLLPLNDQLSYGYPKEHPHHIAAPHLHPRYNYSKFVGGILLVNRDHFKLVNGMSNKYWGWGLEDDEFYVRLREAKLEVTRPQNILTDRTNTFRHVHGINRKRDTTKCFNQREVTRKRDRQTGLNNVNYTIINVANLSIENATIKILNIHLLCNFELTPWCDCSEKKSNSRNNKI